MGESTTTHTPKPWTLIKALEVQGPEGETICLLPEPNSDRRRANGPLLAAAPKLLEALAACQAASARIVNEDYLGTRLEKINNIAQAAIAKATNPK